MTAELLNQDYIDELMMQEGLTECLVDIKPQFTIFTSALNVELVYIILKSIITFQYIRTNEHGA